MTDDKIKEEMLKALDIDGELTESEIAFQKEMDKHEAKPECASAYYTGFRTAERLAKIEVLELAKQMFNDLDEMNPIDYTDSFDVINTLLEELKPTK